MVGIRIITFNLAIDSMNHLHVAGNMHVTKLVYGRMDVPDNLESLKLTDRMTGVEEDHVTYPQFFQMHDGSLLFLYREGGSPEYNLLDFDSAAEKILLSLPPERRSQKNITDSMIASVALKYGYIVVTRNVRDFGDIEGVEVEAW